MEDFTVTFQPENKTVKVEKGETIMDASIKADVFINSVCGGLGKCGKCKVKVEGDVLDEEAELISEEERTENIHLACKAKVQGDITVYIPERTRAGLHQILTKRMESPVKEVNSLTKKTHIVLQPPTLEDNISDLERLRRALEIEGIANINISLGMLKDLASILRKGKWDVTLTIAEMEDKNEIINVEPYDTTKSHFGLAVDVGTTTIAIALIDMNTGEVLSTKANYNKQIICGEDVLARITYAEEHGVDKLNQLVVETINYLIEELTTPEELCRDDVRGKTCKSDISFVTIAGNTTMLHLLLSLDPSPIRLEPYIPTVNRYPYFKARDLNLDVNPEAYVYCMPCRSSYVGGDITADVLASGLYKSEDLCLLIDVGTNGEVVIGNRNWMISCSCSAGPAFEGGEVGYGMRAAVGAIERVALNVSKSTEKGDTDIDVYYKVIGNRKPRGICGSGLIDLIAELFSNGIIDRAGNIKDLPSHRIKEGDEGNEFVIAWACETDLGKDVTFQKAEDGEVVKKEGEGKDIVITEADIKNIIRTKAAVYAACSVLLKSANLTFNDVDTIYIAGGFGNYLDTPKAITLGLLPDVSLDKFKFIGNGALAGAQVALLSEELKKEAEDLYQKMTYIELSVSNVFYNEFTSALFLPHTDLELFPTVKEKLGE